MLEGDGGQMRFVKRVYLLFLFSLALGLFCSEIPETFTLEDDISNDFIQECPASISPCTLTSQEHLASQTDLVEENEGSQNSRIIPITFRGELAAASGRDLLRLHSVQRK